MFVGKARSIPYSEAPERYFTWTWVDSGLTWKHWTLLEKLVRDKHSSLLRELVNCGQKMFYNIGPRPGGSFIELFSLNWTLAQNKLTLVKIFGLSNIWTAGAYPSWAIWILFLYSFVQRVTQRPPWPEPTSAGHLSVSHFMGRLLTIPANIRLAWMIYHRISDKKCLHEITTKSLKSL